MSHHSLTRQDEIKFLKWESWASIIAVIIALATGIFAYGYEKSQNETTRQLVLEQGTQIKQIYSIVFQMNGDISEIKGKINK